ncbi:MAG: hypothetical protein GKR89_36555 [Candidatus Latescibacteria bacterium]|nr:hypothetical protein [Candidatus Latescibacterota bacterium]
MKAHLFVLATFLAASTCLYAEEFVCRGHLANTQTPQITLAAAKPVASRTTGTRQALVLFARFADDPDTDPPNWAGDLFDLEQQGSFSHFYHTMSFGQLQIDGDSAPRRYVSAQNAAAYLSETP